MKLIPSKNAIHLSRLFFYIFALIILYSLAFTPLKSQSICYWYQNYNVLCPMCGGTRSLLGFMTLNFKEALFYNASLTLGLYPIALFLILQDSYAIVANSFFKKQYISLLLFFMNLFNKEEG